MPHGDVTHGAYRPHTARTTANSRQQRSQYNIVRVVKSTVKSHHKAVLLCAEQKPVPRVKSTSKMTFRQLTPKQHAVFLEHISTITLDTGTFSSGTARAQFDYF